MNVERTPGSRRAWWRWVAVGATALTLTILVVRLGTGPFLDGLRAVDGATLVAATVVGALTTICSAWRWTIVARGIGIRLSMRSAVASYYRSQFLNLTLPGGVVGDVHRAVSHGRNVNDVGRGLRAVMWERLAGQVVQAVLTVIVLIALPSPVRSSVPVVAGIALLVVVAATLLIRAPSRDGSSPWSRIRAAVADDVRRGLVSNRAWVGIAVASALVVAGHAAMFIVAARTAGTHASIATLLPLTLLAMLAMVLPSAAGIGPREGASAWAFAGAGLGADRGVATAVAFGVMSLVASLPGAAVLLAGALRARPALVGSAEGRADG